MPAPVKSQLAEEWSKDPAVDSFKWPLLPYSRPPQTTDTTIKYAPLVEIDFSNWDEPGEKQRLADQLHHAVRDVGFYIVKGHGISDEEVLEILQIANSYFHTLDLEEKRKNPIDLGAGQSFGYREPTRYFGDTGIKETLETYEVHKDLIEYKDRPTHPFFKSHWHKFGPFHRKLWTNVARRLLILHALILELPEDYFLKMHEYNNPSEDFIRLMLNHPRSRENHVMTEPYNIGGHADFGSLTMLFEQNVLGLQMLSREGEWLWVKPVKGGITINAGESLQHMTKGYVKATIHRVYAPPDDQLTYERLGCIYFCNVGNGYDLRPVPSPLLKRLGLVTDEELDPKKEYPSGGEYVRSRRRNVHNVKKFEKRRADKTDKVGSLEVRSHFD